VKRHHPDANGGDRTSDKLREIIEAYNYNREFTAIGFIFRCPSHDPGSAGLFIGY
jgi:hypothetical protein